MDSSRALVPLPPEPAEPEAVPSPSSATQLKALLTRRWILGLAGAGFVSGVAARQVIGNWAPPADGAVDQVAGLAAHPSDAEPALLMEEEPLPHDVHLPTLPPAPPHSGAPQLRMAEGAPSVAMATEPDPLIPWAPEPVPSAVKPFAAIAPIKPAAPKAPSPPPATATAIVRPPAMPSGGQQAWLRNARPFIDTKSVPAIAIVIDDLGLSTPYTRQAIALPSAVTLAFMTYASGLEQWTGTARANKHELLVHVPMQPINGKVDPGPRALTVGLSDDEIRARLRWGLGRMDGYVGINNHMGSRFTQDRAAMSVVMTEIKSRGLLFLDSVTIGRTVGAATAEAMRVPAAERNVFLDDVATVAGVSHQIAVLEQVARRHGSAIAIGHPHPATLSVLAQWLPGAAARGVAVVPLTSVMRRNTANA